MTPEQRRRNRRLAFILVLLVCAISGWTLFRGAYLLRA